LRSGTRILLIAWLLVLTACGAWLYRNLSLTTDLSAFLPPSATPAQRILLGQLRDGATSRLVLIGLEGAHGDVLARASSELARRLATSGLFAYVNNGEARASRKEQAVLFEHRYLLSPAVGPKRFTIDGLKAALADTYGLLGSSAGVLVRAMLPADPTGEMGQIVRRLGPGGGPDTRHGVWFSRDGRRALLVAQSRAPAFDADAQRRVVHAINEAYAATGPGTGRIVLSGPGVFAASIRDTVESEIWRLSVLGAALVLAILYAAYRSATMLGASFLPVATGLVVGVTAVALGFHKVHGITLGFGVTLIGEAIDYPTYLFMQARPEERLDDALARIGPTLKLAVLTTVFGALAMALSSFEGLAQLGVLTIAGVTAAGLTTRWILPILVPVRPALRDAHAHRPWLDRIASAARGLRGPAAALAVAALGLIAWKHDRLWDDDISSLTPVSESAKQLDRSLREALGAPSLRYLLVARGNSRETALQASESAAEWLRGAVRKGWLAGFDVPSTYLPSRRTQEARRAALPERDALATRLAAALADSPFRANGFAPFLDAVARARSDPLLEMRDFDGTALSLKVGSLLFRNEDGWNALATLRAVSAPAELAREASAHGDEFIDLKDESNRLVNTYKNQALRFVAAGLACIVALLVAALGGALRAARVVAPTLAAVALDVAVLLLLGKKLSLFNLVALLLVVGVGLNYALFFARRHADEGERRRTQRSLAVCAATTFSVFGCLTLSRIPVLHEIGVTVALGAALSLMFAAAFAAGPEDSRPPV
jgi:predicted exporter